MNLMVDISINVIESSNGCVIGAINSIYNDELTTVDDDFMTGRTGQLSTVQRSLVFVEGQWSIRINCPFNGISDTEWVPRTYG